MKKHNSPIPRFSDSPIRLSKVYDRWAPWVLVGLTAAVPLLFDFSLYDTFDLPKMLLVYAAVLVLAGLWFWQQSAGAEKEIGPGAIFTLRLTGMALPVLVFLGIALVSCRTSIDPSRSLFGAYRSYVYGWIPMTAFALLFYFTALIRSEEVLRWVTRAALISGTLAGLYGLLQYTGNEIFDAMPRVVGGRVWSSLGNPIYFGAICMMALPLALSRWSPGNALATLLLLAGLLISLSRGAWLGSVVAVAYLLFVFRHQVSAHRSKIVAGFLAVGLLSLVFPQARGRLRVLVAVHESSNAGRIEGWKAGIKVWRHYPLLGTGPDTFFEAFRPYRNRTFIDAVGGGVTQSHAHNELIQFAATLGSAGLLAWIWVVFAFLRQARHSLKMVPGTIFQPLVASLAAIFVQNQFNPPSAASAAWTAIFAGLVVSFSQGEKMAVGQMRGDRTGPPHLPSGHPLPREKVLFFGIRVIVLLLFLGAGIWAISIPLRAEHSYKEGIVLDANHKPLEALACYREAVRRRPDIGTYQSALGNSARSVAQQIPDGVQRRRLWDEAWKSAQAAVQWHPANPDDWNNLGVAAMWLTQLAGDNKMSAAKSSFEKAIALDPVFVDAWANLAKWYHIAGDLEGEKRMWKVVLQLDPHHAMALQVLGNGSKVSRS